MTLMTLFYILSAITLATAFLTIISKNPIHSAIYLVICFFTIGGHYVLFNAQFLAIVHIIVYAGAIVVLFLFTIMLMNLNRENETQKKGLVKVAAAISACLVGLVLFASFVKSQPFVPEYYVTGEDFQSVKKLGKVLLDEKEGFAVPFEFASILLLVAMIGAVLLSKKEKQANG